MDVSEHITYCPVNAVYLKKDIVDSPLILWLCDNGCIWTYYLLSLLNLRKGGYSIISGNNSQTAYRTLHNESHTLLGELLAKRQLSINAVYFEERYSR